MKITVSLVLMVAILLPAASFTGLSAGNLLAMGSKRGFDELQNSRNNKGEPEDKTGKVKGRGEKRLPEESGEKPGNSPSRKKPRLKYRDLYECGC